MRWNRPLSILNFQTLIVMKRSDNGSGDKKQGNMQWFLLGLIVGAGGYYAYELYSKPKSTPTTTTPTGGRPMPIEDRPSITTFADTSGNNGCGCKGGGVTIITAGNVAGIRERI